MTQKTHDPALSQTIRTVLLVGGVLAVCGYALSGPRMGLSAAVGAGMAYANLVLLARSVARLLSGGGGSWAMVFVLKFTALFAVTYLLIDRELVAPLGLALGFGALPIGIVASGLLQSTQTQEDLPRPHSPVASASSMEADPRPAAAERD